MSCRQPNYLQPDPSIFLAHIELVVDHTGSKQVALSLPAPSGIVNVPAQLLISSSINSTQLAVVTAVSTESVPVSDWTRRVRHVDCIPISKSKEWERVRLKSPALKKMSHVV